MAIGTYPEVVFTLEFNEQAVSVVVDGGLTAAEIGRRLSVSQLHHVVSDITGATGLRIINAIIEGNHEPAEFAKFRDVRCKASEDTIRKALKGIYRKEHLFTLKHALEL